MGPLFCVTAINKLTRERERISLSGWSKEVVDKMKSDYLKVRASKRTHVYPRVSVLQKSLFD